MSNSPTPHQPPSRLPLVLLGLMTIASFGGPFAAWAVIRGGESPDWPPDRLVEWVVFAAIVALVVILMAACLSLYFVNRRQLESRRAATATRSERP